MSLPTPEVRTTPLRQVSRHLQQTVSLRLKAALTDFGWLSDPTPFDSAPFVLRLGRMTEKELAEIKPNFAAVTFGDEPPEEEQELGGGLSLLRTQVAVDVIPDSEALGLALASDVRDVMYGKFPDWPRVFPLRDYSLDPAGVPTDDYVIEFVDVARRRPDQAEGRLHWQQVIADIELTMPGFS